MTVEPLVTIDATQPAPPYVQIRDQIADLISGGGLAAGARLPSVRQLAADLGLAPGTAARAYQELEAGGYVTTRRGGGTRVAAQSGAATRKSTILEQRAREYVDSVRRLGVSRSEAIAAVQAAFDGR
jgi:DNA-binding transcriptional regulator YhcF (GntR family)